MTVADALRDAVSTLDDHGVGSPALTARVFLGDILGRDQAWLAAHSEERLGKGRLAAFEGMLRARCQGVPTQYIRGIQEFYGLEFRVTPDVLIPRPETEHLVEAALERIGPGVRVADIGTGSGAVAVAIARNAPGARVCASDISQAAVGVARANANRLGATVAFCVGDLLSSFGNRSVDMVVSNPPYVPLRDAGSLQRELRHEPSVALYGGEDGLAVLGRLSREAPRALRPGGWLLAEIGYNSRPGVERLLAMGGWDDPVFLPDLSGIDRVVAVRRPSDP